MWRDAYRSPSGRAAEGPRGVARLVGESEPMCDLKAKILSIFIQDFHHSCSPGRAGPAHG